MNAGRALRLLINSRHVFADTGGPYAGKGLLSAFVYLLGWFALIIHAQNNM
jgi:hypothetical protein